jgi:flagellar assembly protein FliH
MGKVIKGSAQSTERFTLVVPALRAPASAHVQEDGFVDDADLAPSIHEPEPPPEPAIDFAAIEAQAAAIVAAAEASAQSIVDAAQERAATITADAATQARQIAHDARREAHDAGYADGREAVNAEMSAMLGTLRDLIDAVRGERHGLLAAAEPELVRLAVGIAERVLHQQIALDHSVVVEMARAAIARIVDRERITVRVNPSDVERMRDYRDELLALGDVKTMLVIEDQRVDRGGVILETDAGSIDAKIATQLAEVRKILHIVDDVVVGPVAVPSDESDETPLTAFRAS